MLPLLSRAKPLRIIRGEFVFLGFVNAQCPPYKCKRGNGDFGTIVAAVPTTANGLVKPSFTLTTDIGWYHAPNGGIWGPCAVGMNSISVAGGHMYVVDAYVKNVGGNCSDSNPAIAEVRVYPSGANGLNVKPQRLISGTRTRLYQATGSLDGPTNGIAVGADGTTYLGYSGAERGSPTILSFEGGADGNVRPEIAYLPQATGSPQGSVPPSADTMALDAQRLYVAEAGHCNAVQVLSPRPAGHVKPLRQFGVSASVTGIAVRDSKVYATYFGSSDPNVRGSVQVFDLNDLGTATGPCYTVAGNYAIGGPATGLNHPWNLALDAKGNIYVLDMVGGRIVVRVYDANASGNAKPIRTIVPDMPKSAIVPGGIPGLPFAVGEAP